MYGRSIASRIVAHDSARVEGTIQVAAVSCCTLVLLMQSFSPRDIPFTVFDIDTDSERVDVDERLEIKSKVQGGTSTALESTDRSGQEKS